MPTGGVTRWSVSALPLALSIVLSVVARPSPSQAALSSISLLSTCTIHHSGFDLGALPQFSRASSRLTTELCQAVTFISRTVTLARYCATLHSKCSKETLRAFCGGTLRMDVPSARARTTPAGDGEEHCGGSSRVMNRRGRN